MVQGTLMRATIHLVSSADYRALATAIGESRRRWFLRVGGREPEEYAAAARRVRSLLAAGPQPRRLLEEAAGPGLWAGVGMWLDLVRVPPSGTWERRRADLFAAADDWIPGAPPPVPAALWHLIRRYLGAFGPALPAEIAVWAGIPPDLVGSVLADATAGRSRLRTFLTEDGQRMVDLFGAPLPEDGRPAPVRFLPVWDATLLVHARRKAVISEEHRPAVFNTKNPHSSATFLVDGTVAGTWRFEGGRVKVEPFAPMPRPVRREVEEEAAALTALYV